MGQMVDLEGGASRILITQWLSSRWLERQVNPGEDGQAAVCWGGCIRD